MNYVPDHWRRLAVEAWDKAGDEVMREGRVLSADEILDLILNTVLTEMRQQVDDMQADAYIDWRSAVPGDTGAVAVAAARAETLATVLNLIDTGDPRG